MNQIANATESLHKLVNGRAMASLPIRDLLRVCVEQQDQIDCLRAEIEALKEGVNEAKPS